MRTAAITLLALASSASGCFPFPCDEGCTMRFGRDPRKVEGSATCRTAGERVTGSAPTTSCTQVDDDARVEAVTGSVCRTVGGVQGPWGVVEVECLEAGECLFTVDAFDETTWCECAGGATPVPAATPAPAVVEEAWLERPCFGAGECYNPAEGACTADGTVACFVDPCEVKECPSGSVCRASYCGGCHAQCVAPLEEGDVCRSGGVETGRGVDRVDECPAGTACKARAGEVGLGGEVAWTCQAEDPVVCCLAFPFCDSADDVQVDAGDAECALEPSRCYQRSMCCSTITCKKAQARGCPEDARVCADGSVVVRNPGKDCSFDACPSPACRDYAGAACAGCLASNNVCYTAHVDEAWCKLYAGFEWCGQ